MSDDSSLQVLRRHDVPRMSRVRSIYQNALSIIIFCLVFLLLICLTAIWSLRIQSTKIDYLLLKVNPVVDANIDIFREMAEAQSQILQYQFSHDLSYLVKFYSAQTRANLTIVKLNTDSTHFTHNFANDESTRMIALEQIQRDAVERWFAYALFIEKAVNRGEATPSSTEVQLFEGFRRANTEFDKLLQTTRADARTNARTASNRGTALIIAAALIISVVALVFGMRLTRRISKPIINLSDTMRRHHQGDKTARAKENHGSLETMAMAHQFNVMIERQIYLEQVQERALKMHELASKIGNEVRLAPNTHQSLEIVSSALGEGLSADRVLINTLNADDDLVLAAQWHLPNLPPLGFPPEEAVRIQNVFANELWQSGGTLVSHRRPAPDAQSERSKMFYRYTDAQAGIAVPIGMNDQVIGMVYVVMIHQPRHWEESEIVAVQRVAMFVAESIVEDAYRTKQAEHIELLTRLDIQKANFVATVSHELRTPLTSIIGYLEVLKDGYAGELIGEQSRLVEVIDRNATRLLGLINNLLTLTKSESVGHLSDATEVSISELITESCNELPPIVHSDAVKLEIDAGPETAKVLGDKGQLKSVIVNIVSNAIKFSRPGGVVKICCALDEGTNRIRVIVEDSGIGIPIADQDELFSRFFRASNATTKFIPGTGLGLSIVKQIVNEHGGDVRLSSVEGEGTTVTVDLPLALTRVAHNPK